MPNPSKRKGSGFEREVVALLQAAGLAAERQPLSGALGGRHSDDVLVTVPVLNCDKTIECKRRARQFKTLYSLMGDAYALVVRDDHTKPLVIMPLDRWAALARGEPKP